MKRFLKSKLALTLITIMLLASAITVPLSGTIRHSHAAPSSSQASWNIVPSPNNGTGDNKLDNVAAISANNVWAVGRYSTGSGQPDQPLVEQWNGTSWNVVTTPSISSTGWLAGITVVPGTSDMWAVGAYAPGFGQAQTLFEYYNGSTWSQVSGANVTGSNNYLYKVAALSATDIWAVGDYWGTSEQTLIEHYDGTSWSVVASPNVSGFDNELRGIAAVSSNDIWAVGDHTNTNGFAQAQTVIEHYDGTSWTIVLSPNVSGSASDFLVGITVVSSNDIWAVGNFNMSDTGNEQPLAEHYDGTTWTVVSTPSTNLGGVLNGVTAISSSDVWAVGLSIVSGSSNQTLTEHFDGTSWSIVVSPNTGSAYNFLNGVAAVSTNDVWAVGNNGFYGLSSNSAHTLIEHYLSSTSPQLNQLSSDTYTNSTSQHKTEVEPDTFSFGSTIVSAFQVGRFTDGGSSNLGWATSSDSGTTWKHAFLPGITKIVKSTNPYDRVSDASVAYDAAHKTWMIASIGITATIGSPFGAAVLVSRSTDGLSWNKPVKVAIAGSFSFFDKPWMVCDNTVTSKFYGHCYIEWDNAGRNGGEFYFNGVILMSTSTDGGLTWGGQKKTSDQAHGIGGQPLVQPNGTVIVPFLRTFFTSSEQDIAAFTSTTGGTSWSSTVTIAIAKMHTVGGNLRSDFPLPSAEIDGSGKVYLVWSDCQLEPNCSTNDIVMSSSTDGVKWNGVTVIPLDPFGTSVDHFIPGIAVDKSTSGNTAHIVLIFYYYPVASCSTNCQLDVGFASSPDGGNSWSARTQLAGPMTLSWLANTNKGFMVGDYISASFSGGKAYPVFAVAKAPSGGLFNEAMYTVAGGLS